jgi:fibro-slime domain-containing protein
MWTAPRLVLASVLVSSIGLGACAGVKQNPAGQDGGANRGGNGGGLIGGTDALPPPVDGTTINTSKCGNGMLDTANGEQCDDGNTTGADGCSRICQIAAGWECPTPGQPCRLIAKCGDGMLTSNETCDDGNTAGGDGCSADCSTIDTGFACRVPGRKCVPACGDGMIITGKEQCDDGNTTADDGCSPTCIIEPGASCTGTPSVCKAAICGNKIVETGEGCDCGTDAKAAPTATCPGPNGLFFGDGSGCSKSCTKEPKCRDGATTRACDTSCGNGNVEMGEACDDGNLAAGDGCSATCTAEAGFMCMPQMRPDTQPCSTGSGECLQLPVIYRDFKNEKDGGHPDFFYLGAPVTGGPTVTANGAQVAFSKRYCVSNTGGPAKGGDSTARCWGIMSDNLGANGKPTFNTSRNGGGANAFLCDCQFTDWSHLGNPETATGVQHVPGYGDAGAAGKILNGLPYKSNPMAGQTGAPWFSGQAPIVKDAASVGQWFTDNTFTGGGHTVGLLEMAAAGGGQYQFISGSHAVYGGFFPLDPPMQFPAGNNTATPAGPGVTRMVGTEALLCNLWPYWFSTTAFGAGAGCRGDQYLFPPTVPSTPAMPNGMWVTGLQGWFHNFWFTSEARYLFTFTGPFSAQFYGDDDLFIYINGRLVLDLGGVHQRLPGLVSIDATGNATITEGGALTAAGTINACPGPDPYTMVATTQPADCRTRAMTAAQLGLMPNRTYEIAVFHADRHPSESNYQLTLSGFTTNRSNCGPTCGDGVTTGAEECDCGATTASSDPLCAGMPNNNDTYGGCTIACKYGPYCGDGMKNGAEECDMGSKMNNATYGAGGCTPGCKTPHYCGDGLVDETEGEQCDLGSNNGMPDQQCNKTCQIIFG